MVPSTRPDEKRRFPDGPNVTVLIAPRWPWQETTSVPVMLSQIFTTAPTLVANCLPSGLNATLVTQPSSICSVNSALPLNASQTIAVLSKLPVTTLEPLELKATLYTLTSCPSKLTIALTSGDVPQFDCAVAAARNDPVAVWAETHTGNRPLVSLYR